MKTTTLNTIGVTLVNNVIQDSMVIQILNNLFLKIAYSNIL